MNVASRNRLIWKLGNALFALLLLGCAFLLRRHFVYASIFGISGLISAINAFVTPKGLLDPKKRKHPKRSNP